MCTRCRSLSQSWPKWRSVKLGMVAFNSPRVKIWKLIPKSLIYSQLKHFTNTEFANSTYPTRFDNLQRWRLYFLLLLPLLYLCFFPHVFTLQDFLCRKKFLCSCLMHIHVNLGSMIVPKVKYSKNTPSETWKWIVFIRINYLYFIQWNSIVIFNKGMSRHKLNMQFP